SAKDDCEQLDSLPPTGPSTQFPLYSGQSRSRPPTAARRAAILRVKQHSRHLERTRSSNPPAQTYLNRHSSPDDSLRSDSPRARKGIRSRDRMLRLPNSRHRLATVAAVFRLMKVA